MDKNKLPLRLGIGAVVLNKDNKVFVGKRKDNPIDKWQMPQGGVDEGENLVDAMKRELKEETSIINIKIIKEIDDWMEYELPEYLIGKIWKGRYRGQKQKWFVVKFLGKDDEINLKTNNQEFIDWKWLSVENLPSVIVNFKKEIYKKLVPIIRSNFSSDCLIIWFATSPGGIIPIGLSSDLNGPNISFLIFNSFLFFKLRLLLRILTSCPISRLLIS